MPVEDLATQVMERLAPAGGYDDDVALLLYRHPAPLEMTFRAESGQLAPVRSALRSWLDQCDLPRRPCRTSWSPPVRRAPTPLSTVTATVRGRRSGCGLKRSSTICGCPSPTAGAGRRRSPNSTSPRSGRHPDARDDAAGHHHPRPERHHRRHVYEDQLMTTPLTLASGHRPDGNGGPQALSARST